MTAGPTVLLVYGAFMVLGGVMGLRAGSKVSLWAGVGSGVLLGLAWLVTRTNLSAGLWLGAAIAGLLCVVTGMRLAKTRKAMPSGMLLAVSLIALGLLVSSALAAS